MIAPSAGVRPALPELRARIPDWTRDLVADARRVTGLVERWGSPVHLHRAEPLGENARSYRATAAAHGVVLDLFLARKANKALVYVEAAAEAGLGLDVASEAELRQCLEAGVGGARIVVTAALKSDSLLRLALEAGACVVVDHLDEIDALGSIAREADVEATMAVRLRGFSLPNGPHESRFGIHLEEAAALGRALEEARSEGVYTRGLHFHLDGYAALDRAYALDTCIDLVDDLRQCGHPLGFIDMGGGFPVSYLSEAADWWRFLDQLDQAILEERPPITYRNTGFGRHYSDGQLGGRPLLYPHHQAPTGGDWLGRVLDHPRRLETGSVAEALKSRQLTLRAEPGRALVDGCGVTLARVEFVKPIAPGGDDRGVYVGVAMNSSNCRSRKSELCVDPILVRAGDGVRDGAGAGASKPFATEFEGAECGPPPAVEGFVVGAYCAEDDLITSRRLCFPDGVAVGDVLLFPNTAGYYMHFVESRSHQFPLPLNVVLGPEPRADRLDRIDAGHPKEAHAPRSGA